MDPDRKLDDLLKKSFSTIEPSAGFDRAFWQKVAQRQRVPWAVRLLDDLSFWIPVPSIPQAVAAALVALMIGTAGGTLSDLSSLRSAAASYELAGVTLPSISTSTLQIVKGA